MNVTDALMIELVGHHLASGPYRLGELDWWTWWSCRCGFEAVGEADLAPLIERWHDESVGPVAAA